MVQPRDLYQTNLGTLSSPSNLGSLRDKDSLACYLKSVLGGALMHQTSQMAVPSRDFHRIAATTLRISPRFRLNRSTW